MTIYEKRDNNIKQFVTKIMFIKKIKDQFIKLLLGKQAVPAGLFELAEYFNLNDPIQFEFKKAEDGESTVAISTNYRYGSIITKGHNLEELDRNIKDAILTSFEVPGSYANDVHLKRVGEKKESYAIA
ncbi:MAG: hypothetical protein A2458_02260 [Candidatus Kerfeldbacteria bacterium RIFOXYC2_FULL_38_9]|uniref:Uncharacterized protein n=1 Tax=Candidatus Kerfeldbacteria bacterium RIFOXYB2_FULL_38_14 TaxID=1798547 RepID=A0A1G2BE85_9BACT|nr:MAG: hypothetical protein A2319_01955 [Candidatus Kerfeldbacteria bacterium RIFOXYB2_FULL_38_14]OGY90301.1 MAG: hypothetical protein A2458_02260 [Candidatus Kerfeldbacteria bacterium RIFOXYC2_FULL_38_9]